MFITFSKFVSQVLVERGFTFLPHNRGFKGHVVGRKGSLTLTYRTETLSEQRGPSFVCKYENITQAVLPLPTWIERQVLLPDFASRKEKQRRQ
jgi:hypothetical protein